MNIKKKRWIAVILCIYFILISLFSLTYIIKEADHTCIGTHCSICESIQTAQKNMNAFSLADIHSGSIIAVLVILLAAHMFVSFTFLRATPVTQKTRMDN